MKKNKKRKTRRKYRDQKSALKRALNIFYAANALLLGVILLYMGVRVAGRYTERNIDGTFPELMYPEELFSLAEEWVKK